MTTSSLFSTYILLNLFFLLLIEKNFLVIAQELSREHHIIDVKSLLPSNSCVVMPDKNTSPSRLNVVHRHGLCSSQARQEEPSHVELFRQDQARVDYIHHRIANANARLNPIGDSLLGIVPATIGFTLGTGTYIVNIGLGTPLKFFTVGFDTGSDLTWIQCLPCVKCYEQKDLYYDPTQSSTFADISCNSNYCYELGQFGCSSTSNCLYEVHYADKSYTNGSFVQDILTFFTDNIPNFRFGCGHNNSGSFGQTAGLLGLGNGDVSIIVQTDQLYRKVFSYCLPSKIGAIGFLQLGRSITGVSYTRMIIQPNMPFYFVNLIAISFNGARLDYSPTLILLDSGATITRLSPTLYSNLRINFEKAMADYPRAPPFHYLDTCYDFTNHPILQLPDISLIFQGEVMANIDKSGLLYFVSLSQVCLAFTKNNDESEYMIIGNMQQRRLKVVYDVQNLQIGFGSFGCL